MDKKVLLICPHSALEIFKESKISFAVPKIPYVSLASLAAVLLRAGIRVKILDLSISSRPIDSLKKELADFCPDYAGVSFTTGLYQEAMAIAKIIKESSLATMTIAGGVHPTIFPGEVVKEGDFDYAVFGEGEETLLELVSGKNPQQILGLAYKNQTGEIVVNNPRPLLEDLNSLPFPAYYLYNPKNYYAPRITSRQSPVAAIETSRGCVGNCSFCNKMTFGRTVRMKTAERVVDEMEMMLNLGYKEIHIWDDCFSSNLDHPKRICDEIIRRQLKICWNVYNGIRVDRIDEELARKLKQAGCYRVSFGIESGSQEILNNIRKGVTLEQIRQAVKSAKSAGLEVVGFFMIGLPGETKETIEKTIRFAIELDVDLPKVAITTPLPGTDLFRQWQEAGLIHSHNWSDYVFHGVKRVAAHPNLSAEDLFNLYNLFWRRVYLRPKFIWRRFWRGLKTGDIFFDVYYFLKMLFKFGWQKLCWG